MNTIIDSRKQQNTHFETDYALKALSAALRVVGVSGATIHIVDARSAQSADYTLWAYIEQLSIGGGSTFRLYVNPATTRSTYLEAVCHEAIHIKQYLSGRLVAAADNTHLTFEGKTYYPPYNPNVPHESEAYSGQGAIKKQVKKILKEKSEN